MIDKLQVVATGASAVIPLNSPRSMRATAINRFVAAENGGALPLIANRTAAAGWESFTFESKGVGLVAIKSNANGQYVTLNASNELVANAATLSAGHAFTWYDFGGGSFALRAGGGSYVRAPNDTSNLVATGTTLGAGDTIFRHAAL